MNLTLEIPHKYPRGGAKQSILYLCRSIVKQNKTDLAGKTNWRIISMDLTVCSFV